MSDVAVRKLWVDTDPGVDDAYALMLAARPGVELLGLSSVGGNVGLAHTTRNARALVELLGVDAPVHPGVDRPLLRPAPDAAFVHGADGLGDTGLPEPARPAADLHGALALIKAARRHAGELELVALGPLSNVALALALEPALAGWLKRVVVMGGAVAGHGNTTPFAEFNIGYDPEAAAMVFARLPAVELVDWELTLAAAPNITDCEAWMASGSRRADWLRRVSRQTRAFLDGIGSTTWAWADPLAMWAWWNPAGVTRWQAARVEVPLDGAVRGATLLDRRVGPFNARVAMAVDVPAFHAELAATLLRD
ncbi:MAG: nucleoside hydrolase [Xanthomonadales bacterium]|jgi:purine nucleosidase|nr:nucleoside hydrolase [Xanthomonadales bacterium]